jgi:4-amino-4-deoxy-L-arabinose transferase-like glycosyltransferase
VSRPAVASPPRWSWIGLLAILLLDIWLRGHTLGPTVRDLVGFAPWPVVAGEAEPLDCDESAYAYIGRRIVRGDVLYRDLTENKPPGGYWLYALTVSLGGANELAIRLMPIPLVLATIALVWWIGLRLTGPGAACLAAALYAFLSTDPYLFGNGANFEHAINLSSVASLALMIRAADRPRLGLLAAAGMALGIACLIKQVVIANLFLFGFALWTHRGTKGGGPRQARSRWPDLAALGAGFALVWALSAAVLFAQGAAADAYDDIVRYGGALASDTPADPHAPPLPVRWFTGNADPRGNLPWPFGDTDYLVWWGTGSWPLWLAAVPSLAWLAFGPPDPARRLVAGWTLSAWVQVALPRLFWQHYYLLPTPGVSLVVGVALVDFARRAREAIKASHYGRALLWGGLAGVWVAAVGGMVAIQVRDYLLVPSEELTKRYKGGNQWVSLRKLGRDLARRTDGWEDPRLFIWGWQSPLFIYSGLDGVSRHFFADPLMKSYANRYHPLIEPRLAEIMNDLRKHPPDLIFAGDPPFPALRDFLSERYLASSRAGPDGRGLWVKRSRYRAFEEAGRRPLAPEGR